MEILLIACMLAYAAGAQSEQSKLGMSPAQRAILKEETRHEKAVRKIADRYGDAPAKNGRAATSPWKNALAANGQPATTIPEAFRSGYRGHTPVQRVATPMGRRAGGWVARGVAWGQDTGRGALREFRKRRQAGGGNDPAPVLVPLPPAHPPTVPPMPTQPPQPPAAAAGAGQGVSLTKPAATTGGGAATAPASVTPPQQQAPVPAPTGPTPQPAANQGGTGRMAAEVTYESVMDESDELSLMCDDDVRVYDRIRTRCEREVGRADELIAAMDLVGFGPTVISWVVRAKEQYQVIQGQVDDLQTNTMAQGEQVVKAKALLEAGQGVYAGIAQDMEDVADRDAYVSDAVDAEDTTAHTEVYETQGA
ncbi:hypothetical protein [Streptomyces europaeiscabiei]|uniref:hypothetical protein n=1 Tax=Streptomyces europaeiscabiei TaxID=146819 RepID=UPI0029A4E8EF|nr:hypothetical protein [Streptomyces europaeiscabiei]MDX2757871.1 hypothetical protein [Streptomyces europaeiscabiei]MDX3549470.1 hypothetical protein [Streptomyces europaeiscabiei]